MRTLSVFVWGGGGGGGLWVVGFTSFTLTYLGYVSAFCLCLCLCSYFHSFRVGLCVRMSGINFMF